MTDPLAEKIGINVQGGTVNVQNLNIGIAERLEKSGDRVRILVVAANPLGSSPLKLDHEVKTIQEALRRSRKRDNFLVEYRLAATPSELRRALLDVEPHVLHFSGHGAGKQGLLFVSDESAGAIYRSDSGEVRSRSTSSNEIKFVPAQPLANLLQLCDEHLECVVLNACYSDVQGNEISANIPFTIGMRDQVADNVAIKFSQGFYDAIGAGKGYEMAFEWGKSAIECDLVNNSAAKILVLRKKGEKIKPKEQKTNSSQTPIAIHNISKWSDRFNSWMFLGFAMTGFTIWIIYQFWMQKPIVIENSTGIPTTFIPTITPSSTLTISNRSAEDFYSEGLSKYKKGDYRGSIANYNEAIRLNPNYAVAYFNRGNAKGNLEDNQGAITDFNEAIRLNSNDAYTYNNRGNAKAKLGDYQGAITDFSEAIRLNPNLIYPYRGLGKVKAELGDNQGAITDFNKAILLNPNDAYIYINRGSAKAQLGDKQGAIVDYNEAIRLNPNDASAYFNRGNAKFDLGDKQGAIVDYNEVIRLNPNDANAYNNRGNAKSDLGDKEGAIPDYNEAIRLKDTNTNLGNSYYGRGNTYKQTGEKQKALADFRKASELYQQQGNTELYNNSRDRIRELGG